MTASSEFVGLNAALRLRLGSTVLRVGLMAAVAGMLATVGHWAAAPYWLAAYVVAQVGFVVASERGSERHGARVYALAFTTYAIAGTPAWPLWLNNGDLGIAAATLFLTGMIVQLVVSSLGARRLFWASAAPLIFYLVVIPPLAFGAARLAEGLAVSACALIFTSYMTVLWFGQQKALLQIQDSRAKAEIAQHQAEAASAAKTEFLAAMSHELRTPMNAVLGAADLLGRTRLDDEQRAHVRMLADGGVILMQVLNDVLDLAKIEAGKLLIDPITIDVQDFLRRCAALWEPRARDKGLGFSISVAPGAPAYCEMDVTRVGQIIFNLISNALKFTEAGEVSVSLETEELADGGVELVFRVRDSGIGMSEETLARLFTAFQQADGSISRRFGGTGLGLSISQNLAGMMGGQISVESVEGVGSVFSLRLPVRLAEAPDGDEARSFNEDDALRPALRILVAEDNPSNQRIIDLFLRPIGAAVTLVENGQLALDTLAVETFDLVLMDLQMPVMDGLEATRRLRASSGPNAHIPVVALTANVMESHRKACADAGMNGHISKPIDARLLLATVLNTFDSAEHAPALAAAS